MRLSLAILLGIVLAAPAGAQPPALGAPVEDIIVRYRPGADAAERADARRDAGVRREHGLPLPGAEVVDPRPGVSVREALAELEADPDVDYAEPDARRVALALPDDAYFGAQWGLRNSGQEIAGRTGTPGADIDAVSAWDRTTGSADVVVAVVDTGVDLDHPDLAPNLFRNVSETPANHVDDDRNGFVDDVRGWDFASGDPSPEDVSGHGTHVAGTIAARGNDGVGVTGVSWRSTLLPLRVLDADGSGTVSDAIRAYRYAASAGAGVVNLSLGGDTPSAAERDAIAALPGVLFVAAAGNDGLDIDMGLSYPCEYDLPNVLCVAASDRSDALATFSNFGAASVDLAAPGVDVASTYTDDGWALLDGTSMAAPHVSGAAALLLSLEPGTSVAALRTALLEGAERRPELAGRVTTGARLDVPGALGHLSPVVPLAPPAPADEPPPPEATPVEAPPDRSAPLVGVTAQPRRDLGRLLRRGLQVRVDCSEGCAVTTALFRGTRRLARAGTTRREPGTSALLLRLSRRDRARLRRASVVRLGLTTVARDPAGNARRDVRRLRFRR